MIAVLLSLLRILVVLLVLRLVVRFVAAAVQGYRSLPPRTQAPAHLDLVRDAVCNTFVPRDRALVRAAGGRVDYFCSTACLSRSPLAPS